MAAKDYIDTKGYWISPKTEPSDAWAMKAASNKSLPRRLKSVRTRNGIESAMH